MPLEINVGDIATMRKTHPCGSTEWVVYRTGLDIGIRCLECGRRVLMPRKQFERAVKKLRPPEPESESGPEPGLRPGASDS